MKNFKLFGLTLIVAAVVSVLSQLSGIDQLADTRWARSLLSSIIAMAFVFLYDMKVSESLSGGTNKSIYSSVQLGLFGYAVAVVTGVLVSYLTF